MKDRIDHRSDLKHEPHVSSRPVVPDDSNMLEEEPARASEVQAESTEMSVSDEPAMSWAQLDRNALPGYAELVLERFRATSPGTRFLAMLLAGLAAGPFAVLGALIKSLTLQGGYGYIAIVIVGPVIEEMLKVGAILWIVERKPWLVSSVGAILFVGAMGGLGFAAIENLLYLQVYFPDHGVDLAQWRWSVCVMMHTGCSLIAAIGVGRMYKQMLMTGRPAGTGIAFPWFVTAILIHGSYNAIAVSLSMTGLTP
ncbi:MAG: PrsW family intramembrane metalloprotease [Planctomycetes bacterium]|nr:PrsW family intramembrane metalloprotease [Planctomycetota bacterium]